MGSVNLRFYTEIIIQKGQHVNLCGPDIIYFFQAYRLITNRDLYDILYGVSIFLQGYGLDS